MERLLRTNSQIFESQQVSILCRGDIVVIVYSVRLQYKKMFSQKEIINKRSHKNVPRASHLLMPARTSPFPELA